jgi:hypothetical protein
MAWPVGSSNARTLFRPKPTKESPMLRLICGLLILATLAGAVLYFQSDVFRTRTDQVVDSWTKWTPENISKDPRGYLTFAIVELEKIQDRLKAHEIALRRDLDLATNSLKVNKVVEADTTTALDGLKTTYKASARTFPISYNAKDYNETRFQELVVEMDRKLELAQENVASKERLVTFYTSELERAETERKKIEEKRQYVEQQKIRLETDLAIGLANDLTNKADEIAATVKAATKSDINTVKHEADELVKSVEKKRQTQSVKERFEQIMGSK